MDIVRELTAAGLTVDDRRGQAPADYLRAERALEVVDRAVLHQMAGGAEWSDASPMWARVRAHLVVRLSGVVVVNWGPEARLRWGSRWWNPTGLTIEHQGNFPGRYDQRGRPVYWRPEVAGRDMPMGAQVEASRAVLGVLRRALPGMRYVAAHRMIEARKAACPGPDLWATIGEHALRNGYELAPVDPRGLPLPDSWRASPGALGATERGRGAGEGDGTSREYRGPLEPSAFATEGPRTP